MLRDREGRGCGDECPVCGQDGDASMVPEHVQGLSRVPPEPAEGGAEGELFSGGLWGTPNNQHPTTDSQARKAGQSHPKPP
jgi:hypothetical protein